MGRIGIRRNDASIDIYDITIEYIEIENKERKK